MHRNAVHTVADLGIRVGQLVLGVEAAVHRPPRLAGVIGPEYARRRDGDEDPLRMAPVQHDRVQAHPAGARLPEVSLRAAQPRQFLPGFPSIH